MVDNNAHFKRMRFKARVPVEMEVPHGLEEAVAEVFNGSYDAPYAGSGLTILDIGAHVGAFSLWANLRWPRSQIYAYEPHPQTFDCLLRNVGALPNVHCTRRAIYPSDSDQVSYYSGYAGDGEAGVAEVLRRMFRSLPEEKLIEVPALHPAKLPAADIVKIDTEGAEVEILATLDMESVSLITLQYHYRDDRERIKALLQPQFTVVYEVATEWAPLIAQGEYRSSLEGDCYGHICFVNRELGLLSAMEPEAWQHDGSATADFEQGFADKSELPSDVTVQIETAPIVEHKRRLGEKVAAVPPLYSPPDPQFTVRYVYDLLLTMVGRDMKLRYKRSALGIAWSLLNPLAQLLVFSFVFQFVFPLDVPNYTAFLFVGILAWAWFQGAVQQATGAIVHNGPLIGFPGFPVAVLPVVTVSSHLLHFLLALPIVLVFVLASGLSIGAFVLLLPFVILVQFVLCLSLAFLVATLQVFFRDTEHLLGIALMLGFFLTPIFYDLASIPESYRPLFRLNPMVVLIEAYRDILVNGVLPDVDALLMLGVVSTLVLAFSYRLFSRASYRFVEQI